MRKIKYLVSALLLGAMAVNANPVPMGTAQKVAGNFFTQTYNTAASNLTLAYTELSTDGQPLYYVFNIANEGGFVIVSAEDAGFPIIGSSNTGHYVIPTDHNNMFFWMGNRKNEIAAMRANNIKATVEVTNEWTAYINNTERPTHSTSSVNALCSTTWDQPSPYNGMCPSNSLTGCVATAMAQIMKYWNYPWVGLGAKTCYYDEVAYGYQKNYGQLCATFDTSHYVWPSMPNNVTSANKQVAKLMYDCGVSVNMDYSPKGSGAVVIGPSPSALNSYTQYFNFYSYTIFGAMQASYTSSAWVSLLENEFNHGRPVQYQGTDMSLNEGHSWVADGYNGSGIHMNWGWSGYDNGYYSSTALAPAGSGYNFNGDLGAIIGIEPNPTAIQQVSDNISVNVYPNPSHGEFTFELPANMVNAQIKVYNMIGQEVSTYKVTSDINKVNLGNQAKGVYLYRVLNEKGTSVSTGRLVID